MGTTSTGRISRIAAIRSFKLYLDAEVVACIGQTHGSGRPVLILGERQNQLPGDERPGLFVGGVPFTFFWVMDIAVEQEAHGFRIYFSPCVSCRIDISVAKKGDGDLF